YQIISGPMVWISFLIFIFGTIFKIVQFYTFSKKLKPQNSVSSYSGASSNTATPASIIDKFKSMQNELNSLKKKARSIDAVITGFNFLNKKLAMMRYSLLGREPVMVLISTLFHLVLFFSPFLVLGHNVLLDNAFGISFPSISPALSTFFAVTAILCCLFFLIRRVTIPLVRSITSKSDYVMLSIVSAPFISGLMAHHQILDYNLMIHIHILSGEIMLIAIPFTKFVHMIYFFINRFILIHQYRLGSGGSRVWSFGIAENKPSWPLCGHPES
ncbi:MAG: hypothetical protein HQK62_14445, partial [Desulfamplus sp.]|nr:hypothetical protein [Desulfamplus sp.]